MAAIQLPRKTPKRATAPTAQSEQEGAKRQLTGNKGDITNW